MWNKLRAAIGRLLSGGALVSVPKYKRIRNEMLRPEQVTEEPPVWLIVGLGNPDREHAGNRHNVGFMALDRLVYDGAFSDWKQKFQGLVSEGKIGQTRVLLLKPQTYMNLSGKSVQAAAQFYKVAPDKIIVLHDELDLPPAKVRTKFGGGAAGHNGLKSIDSTLGTQNYMRVRIGIGHPGDKARVSGYVLSDFTDDERNIIDLTLAAVSRHFDYLLGGRDADFMTKTAEDTKV